MSLRTTVAAMAAVLSLALPVASSAAEMKVAYVDLQRVLLEVDDGKAAKTRLQKWLEDKQKEIDKEQSALRAEKEALDKQASAMAADVRGQKEAELQRKVMTLAQKWEKSRAEAANKERQEMEPIINKIDQVVASIAQRDDLGLVLEKRDSGIVFAKAQYDISNEVIRAYNSSKKTAAKDAPTK
ncbi:MULTISPECIES: OmpH family outer membrane protein [Myxococcus]|uniref:OmpH family outer membrane protein n=2 Tax=Myxococcus TaxID=32 RepID=L7UC61_MYXSD|nr:MULTISPECIES: OmpH family outer membrane protein [Myxococcus]AGC46466.1 OmpH family outer membrane protein [Myxococcus stipitatus DSM 14675]QSQ14652.1 OmpH family outer membrane protein [Myxococcus landrumus]